MKNFLPAFALTAAFVTPAMADEGNFPLEMAHSYNGTSFEVTVPCAEQAVINFLGGDPSEFRSEVGLVFGSNDENSVIVRLSGERAESDLAMVDWFQVNSTLSQSSINHNGLQGSFIQVMADNSENMSAGEHSAQALEAYLQSCRPNMLLS